MVFIAFLYLASVVVLLVWGSSKKTSNYTKPERINNTRNHVSHTKKTYTDYNGYLRFTDSDILVHRWVAVKKKGRNLKPDEVVHHIDGNKKNNNPKNLLICTQEEHERLHFYNLERWGYWNGPELNYSKKFN